MQNLLPITYYLLPLVLSIPLGILLAKTTKDEKQIYTKYFPTIIPTLAALAIISYFFDKTISLTLTFVFITTLVWHKS